MASSEMLDYVRQKIKKERLLLKLTSKELSIKLKGSYSLISMFETKRGNLGLKRFFDTLNILNLKFFLLNNQDLNKMQKIIISIKKRIEALKLEREECLSNINDLSMPSNNFEEMSLKNEEDKYKLFTARIEELTGLL